MRSLLGLLGTAAAGLTILVFLFAPSARRGGADSSKNTLARPNAEAGGHADWMLPVSSRIASIEDSYKLWRAIQATLEMYLMKMAKPLGEEAELWAFSKLPSGSFVAEAQHAWRIRQGIFKLWLLTGRCEFSDIASDELVQNAPAVMARYRAFLRDSGNRPFDQIVRDNMADTVESLATEYCWPALRVLEEYVWFEDPILVAGSLRKIEVGATARRRTHAAMAKWLRDARPSFLWDPQIRKFTNGGQPFRLPILERELFADR